MKRPKPEVGTVREHKIFEEHVDKKIKLSNIMSSVFPLDKSREGMIDRIHTNTKLIADWCILTKKALEGMFETKLNWTEYDIYYAVVFVNVTRYYTDNMKDGETLDDRIVGDYRTFCQFLNIDFDKYKNVIYKAIEVALLNLKVQKEFQLKSTIPLS